MATRTKYWISVPVKTGRRRVYFADGDQLRDYLYALAKKAPDGRFLASVKIPPALAGGDDLATWLRQTSQALVSLRGPGFGGASGDPAGGASNGIARPPTTYGKIFVILGLLALGYLFSRKK